MRAGAAWFEISKTKSGGIEVEFHDAMPLFEISKTKRRCCISIRSVKSPRRAGCNRAGLNLIGTPKPGLLGKVRRCMPARSHGLTGLKWARPTFAALEGSHTVDALRCLRRFVQFG